LPPSSGTGSPELRRTGMRCETCLKAATAWRRHWPRRSPLAPALASSAAVFDDDAEECAQMYQRPVMAAAPPLWGWLLCGFAGLGAQPPKPYAETCPKPQQSSYPSRQPTRTAWTGTKATRWSAGSFSLRRLWRCSLHSSCADSGGWRNMRFHLRASRFSGSCATRCWMACFACSGRCHPLRDSCVWARRGSFGPHGHALP